MLFAFAIRSTIVMNTALRVSYKCTRVSLGIMMLGHRLCVHSVSFPKWTISSTVREFILHPWQHLILSGLLILANLIDLRHEL